MDKQIVVVLVSICKLIQSIVELVGKHVVQMVSVSKEVVLLCVVMVKPIAAVFVQTQKQIPVTVADVERCVKEVLALLEFVYVRTAKKMEKKLTKTVVVIVQQNVQMAKTVQSTLTVLPRSAPKGSA